MYRHLLFSIVLKKYLLNDRKIIGRSSFIKKTAEGDWNDQGTGHISVAFLEAG